MRSIHRRRLLQALVGSGIATARAEDVHEHIRRLATEAPLKMKFQGSAPDECRAWQRLFGNKLDELLGAFRPPLRWEPRIEETVEFADHQRQSLILRAPGVPELPIYLLTPKGSAEGKRPGVVALHGHGSFGHDAVVGIDSTPERAANIEAANYDFGRKLVRQGYVVVAPCFTPFGRRLDSREGYSGSDPCAVAFVRMQLLGRNLMSENLRDALWALEFLIRQDTVDADRIGCVGLSYGGRMSMLTTAVEPRIRVAVISGALNVMQERIGGRYSCGAQVIPGLLEFGDVPEIAGLIAPRPALWEVGQRDGLMVKEWIPGAWERIQRAYRALGAEEHLSMDSFDGPHRWNGIKATPLLASILKP
ncbi:MAG: prolyl oligopeptidase family serine peptidase [Bryobacterales bacterium]|nr:prolyl oligopeptidase family serine peptidase [Bryobacterales bacterium]